MSCIHQSVRGVFEQVQVILYCTSCKEVLQRGQAGLWSMQRSRQVRQNKCPHGVVTGCQKSRQHKVHSKSDGDTTPLLNGFSSRPMTAAAAVAVAAAAEEEAAVGR